MKGYVEIVENKERYRSCNCCSSKQGSENFWDVRFVIGNSTSLIVLCDVHLEQMKEQVNIILK